MYFIIFFFFNDTATTEIYTLSLHDALPICGLAHEVQRRIPVEVPVHGRRLGVGRALRKQLEAEPVAGVVRVEDRKSTRLNSSHLVISYAVFCLKKKKHSNRKTSMSPPTRNT